MARDSKTSSNVFLPSNGWWCEEWRKDIGNGSINQISASLGFAPSQVHAIHLFDRPHGISAIAVVPFTKRVLYVVAEKGTKRLRNSQLVRKMAKIDWRFEYSAMFVDNILDEAIEEGVWSIAFMQRIFADLADDSDQVYHSDQLGYYLFIQDNCLVDYESSDGLNVWGKELNALNPQMVNCWLAEGFILHGEKALAIEYVNLQADAWASLPASMAHPSIPAYIREDTSIDFFMLRVNEDKYPTPLADFQLRIGSKLADRVTTVGDQVIVEYEGRTYYFMENKLKAII